MDEKIEVILVDIGNTAVKTTEVIDGEFQETLFWDSITSVIDRYDGCNLMVSSVKQLLPEIFADQQATLLSYKMPLPIDLEYDTPETLGADRIAAAVGSFHIFPERDNLIIDVGTCMTIDLVEKTGIFKGGIISPGLTMRMKAMAHYTDQLPDISEEWQNLATSELGKSTRECLYHGAFTGMVREINGVIASMEQIFTSLNIIITGGDAHFFESNLKAHIFAGSKIVQKGLYRIWQHQRQKF